MNDKKPKTPKEWALCRCKLSCKVGKEALDGDTYISTDYALYNLLSAIESLAEAMESQDADPVSEPDKKR